MNWNWKILMGFRRIYMKTLRKNLYVILRRIDLTVTVLYTIWYIYIFTFQIIYFHSIHIFLSVIFFRARRIWKRYKDPLCEHNQCFRRNCDFHMWIYLFEFSFFFLVYLNIPRIECMILLINQLRVQLTQHIHTHIMYCRK